MTYLFDTTDRNVALTLNRSSTHELAKLFTIEKNQRYRIFLLLGAKKFSEVFIFLDDDLQSEFYATLNENEARLLLNNLSANDLKSFLDLYDAEARVAMLKLLERKNAQRVVKLFSYEEDSAGAVSSPHFIIFPLSTTVKEATYNTITNAKENDEIDVIFFHDEHARFVGATTIKDLIAARSTTPISDIIDENFPYVYEDDKFTKALSMIRDYDILMLPVLTHEHEMIGFVSETDALSLFAEDHEKMLRAMVKVSEDDANLSAPQTALTRLPWLLLSVVLNLVIASGLTTFSGLLSAFVGLVLFQPMILGMAGNIGTQSMGVTILSLHEDKIKIKTHFRREFLIALINSLFAGIAGFVVVVAFMYFANESHYLIYGLVVGLALVVAMLISALAGILTPIVLKKLKFDEKAASGPLISTINDFFALYAYFLIALIILKLFGL